MAEISLLVGHAIICPVEGCRWMKPVLDHGEFVEHLREHSQLEQTDAFESLITYLEHGGGENRLLIGAAVMFRVR